MARVQYGSQVTALAGSIGGISFQKNSASDIARLKPSSPFLPSVGQYSQQQTFSFLVKAYNDLSLSNKQAWNAFASANSKYNFWGVEKVLTGYNYFLALSYYKYLLTDSIFTSPPTYSTPASVPSFSVTANSSHIRATFDSTWTESNYALFYATPFLRSSSTYNHRHLRYLCYNHNFSIDYEDLTSDWERVFGITWPPSVGSSSLHIIVAVITVLNTSFIPSTAVINIGSYV
jgi:hypothetical protein